MTSKMEPMQRGLMLFGAVVAMVVTVAYAFVNDNWVLMGIALAAAPMVMLINRPSWWVVLIVGLSPSQILLPGMPQGMQFFHLLIAAFAILTIAHGILSKSMTIPRSPAMYCVWAYLAVLVAIILKRGIGFLAFSGGTVGGMAYLKTALLVVFLMCSQSFKLSRTQWMVTCILFAGSSVLPAIAEAMYTLSHGALQFQYLFIAPYVGGLRESLFTYGSDTAVYRFHALGNVGTCLMVFTLAFFASDPSRRILALPMLGLSLALEAISGFRTGIVQCVVVTVIFYVLAAKPNRRFITLIGMAGFGVSAILLLVPFLSHLPMAVQRAFSFIPFVEVDPIARFDAESSTMWRIDLWNYAWSYVPEYLWIGRGFSVQFEDMMSRSLAPDSLERFYEMHDYHNGPLSILLDTGVPGTICMALFFFFSLREAFRRDIKFEDLFLGAFHRVAQALYAFKIFSFIFIFGDARESTPEILLLFAIIYGLRVTDRAIVKKEIARTRLVDPTFAASVRSG